MSRVLAKRPVKRSGRGPQHDRARERPRTGAAATASTWIPLLRTARVGQWPKNLLVFAAPAAAGALSQPHALLRSCAAFASFCAVSSGTYFLNDALDAAADRAHPVKRHRPVASGSLSVRRALVGAGCLMAAGTAAGTLVSWRLGVVLGTYLAVQLAYSTRLKHQPVFDMATVAGGFVLRAIAGAVAIPVPVSQWFLIVATFGSLLMVAGKRLAELSELTHLGQDPGCHRPTLAVYSQQFLRTVLAISAGGAIIGYSLWAFSLQTALEHHHDPIWFQTSIVPVMLALLRYTFLVDAGQGARPEELVLKDRQLQVLGLAWALLFAAGVYVG